MRSKDMTVLILSFALTIVGGWIFKNLEMGISSLEDPLTLLALIVVPIAAVIIIFNARIKEVGEDLDSQRLEIQKNSERLKIYDRLSKIEERLKVINNG